MKIFLTLPLTIVLSACYFPCKYLDSCEPEPNPDPGHIHADLSLWLEGQKWDFADAKYAKNSNIHVYEGAAILHSTNPGTTIGRILSSLNLKMTGTCMGLDNGMNICPDQGKTWKMYVNGNKVTFNSNYAFEDTDQILLTYQSDDNFGELQIEKQLKKMGDDSCMFSQTCPWEGESPER